MNEIVAVGLIIALAVALLLRAFYRSVTSRKPTCACGHVECPLAGACAEIPANPDDPRPDGCPLREAH